MLQCLLLGTLYLTAAAEWNKEPLPALGGDPRYALMPPRISTNFSQPASPYRYSLTPHYLRGARSRELSANPIRYWGM